MLVCPFFNLQASLCNRSLVACSSPVDLVHGENKLESCLDNPYLLVFSWLASHGVCSFA